MRRNHLLSPLRENKTKYKFIGFDIETYSDKNTFYLGGLAWRTEEQTYYKKFYSKEKFLSYLDNLTKCRKTYYVASNLNFDLTALFYDTPYWNRLKLLFRSGNIIYASFVNKKGIRLKFIDTMNYSSLSVEKLGEILNFQKLEKPSNFIPVYDKDGEFLKYDVVKPQGRKEINALERYNRVDCLISALYMSYMQDSINKNGGKFKITIASSSFDIWRRKFLDRTLLKESHVLGDSGIKDFIFKSYFGGRTEVFKRGKFKNLFYYDINSLYPAVMQKAYPLPNSIRKITEPKEFYISDYEGVSEVCLFSPEAKRPFLPVRDKKLIFPIGKIKGVYTHPELRKALSLGYKIHSIEKQYIYTESFYPFRDFVQKFYELRKEQKKRGDREEGATKLIMNSLYGKFGMKRINKTLLKDIRGMSHKEFKSLLTDDFDIFNHHLLISKELDYEGNCSFPILASYTTSYARILMYDYIDDDSVVYTDTDSIFTLEHKYEDSKELGSLKLECIVDEGEFFKPKCYTIRVQGRNHIKMKGLSRATLKSFEMMKRGEKIPKFKISKIKESLRQGIEPLSSMIVEKTFNLEDNKRVWDGEESRPKELILW